MISGTIWYLATAILQDNNWNPSINCPSNSDLVPKTKTTSDKIPVEIGQELIVNISVNPRGTTECYIDDTIAINVDLEDTDSDIRLENSY